MGHDVEEIDAEGGEEVLERPAAIYVAKASGKVCVRIPGRARRITRALRRERHHGGPSWPSPTNSPRCESSA
jgi:hypothetical protein